MKIDAHQHIWTLSRDDYGWLTPEAGLLYRDYLPADLLPHLRQHGIERTVLVQAAPTVAETEWMLEQAAAHDFIAGVVGWLDFEADPRVFRQTYAQLRETYPKFVGVRPMLQDLDDDRFVLRPVVLENLQFLAAEQFPFDVLVYAKHLPHIAEMLDKVPNLHAVIDHIAKPSIKDKQIEPWAERLEKIAAFPRVHCKLSGMVTEADHNSWIVAEIEPYVGRAVELFGPQRLMFGSDWPVCLLAASYDQVIALVEETLPAYLTEDDLQAIFGGNAARFYGLDIDS